MNMIDVKAADLSGSALDWAVAKANGFAVQVRPYAEFCNASTGHKVKVRYHRVWYEFDGELEEYSPSVDWAQCGPLIDMFHAYPNRYNDECRGVEESGRFFVLTYSMKPSCGDEFDCVEGPTALIAACRAIVASKLGDTVQVPAELVEVRGNE